MKIYIRNLFVTIIVYDGKKRKAIGVKCFTLELIIIVIIKAELFVETLKKLHFISQWKFQNNFF